MCKACAVGVVAAGLTPALGNPAKSLDDVRRQARRRRYLLLVTVQKLMPAIRTATCQQGAYSQTVEVVRSGKGRARFRGVETCGSVWVCPVCSYRISEVRRQEMNTVLAWARKSGFAPFLLTLTHRHTRQMSIKECLRLMKDAKERFQQLAPWRVQLRGFLVGHITATEVTWSKNNGWHVHYHVLLFLAADSALGLGLIEDLRESWTAALRSSGGDCNEHGFQVQNAGAAQEYVAKWGAGEEMTLSSQKSKGGLHPFQLLELYAAGDERAGALFTGYASAFHGRRQLVWSKGLKALAGVGEKEDSEIVSDEVVEPGDQVLATVSLWLWRVIVRRELRAEVLDHAERGTLARFLWTVRREAEHHTKVPEYSEGDHGYTIHTWVE